MQPLGNLIKKPENLVIKFNKRMLERPEMYVQHG